MLPKVSLFSTTSWAALKAHYDNDIKTAKLSDLVKNDPQRFSKFSHTTGDILVDFSKNIITDQTLKLLLDLAKECGLQQGIDAMFNGSPINETENRAVLHIALRIFQAFRCIQKEKM